MILLFKYLSVKDRVRRVEQSGMGNNARHIESANAVAELVVLNSIDKEGLAELVVSCMERIKKLEEIVNG